MSRNGRRRQNGNAQGSDKTHKKINQNVFTKENLETIDEGEEGKEMTWWKDLPTLDDSSDEETIEEPGEEEEDEDDVAEEMVEDKVAPRAFNMASQEACETNETPEDSMCCVCELKGENWGAVLETKSLMPPGQDQPEDEQR